MPVNYQSNNSQIIPVVALLARVATTANIANLAGGAPSTLDGVALAVGNIILVKDETTGSLNGLYQVVILGTGANGTWVRAANFDQNAEVVSGVLVSVSEGTLSLDSLWMLTTNDPITVGTTSLAFAKIASTSSISGLLNQIAVFTGPNSIGGSNAFMFDPVTQRFLFYGNMRRTGMLDKTTSYTLSLSDDGVCFTNLNANRTATLPLIATAGDGTEYTIKRLYTAPGAGDVTISPNGTDTIEGQAFWQLLTIGESVVIRAKGDVADWRIVG